MVASSVSRVKAAIQRVSSVVLANKVCTAGIEFQSAVGDLLRLVASAVVKSVVSVLAADV